MTTYSMKWLVISSFVAQGALAIITGQVNFPSPLTANQEFKVALVKLTQHGENVVSLNQDVLQGRDCDGGYKGTPAAYLTVADPTSRMYKFPTINPGNYSVVAYVHDTTVKNEWIDFELPQLGYHSLDGCLYSSTKTSLCASVLEIIDDSTIFEGKDVDIRPLSPLPELNQNFVPPEDPVNTDHSSEPAFAHYTEVRPGVRALRNRGTSWQRGYSHGHILAQQILDFFNFFLLDDRVRGAPNEQKYKYDGPKGFSEGIKKHMNVSAEFTIRANGMLAGMAARAADPDDEFTMRIDLLERDFTFVDIMAINTYNSYGKISELMNQDPYYSSDSNSNSNSDSDSSSNSCTQFVFFGDEMTGDEGTIAARNMDGENDLRKVTVRSFLLFAEEPLETDEQLKVVHFMWPGFVGASSGFNERGLYFMENSGCNPPLTHDELPAGQPILRDVIYQVLSDASVPRNPTPAQGEQAILKYKSERLGGSCLDGCILVYAQPSLNRDPAEGPFGFLYEGDTWGGEMRLPNEPNTRPREDEMIMASNHYWKFHTDPLDVTGKGAADCNGKDASFSTLWRYEAGQNRVEALLRTHRLKQRQQCDLDELGSAMTVEKAKTLLRTVEHGSTEHSIIFLPDQMTFHVAISSLDAPMNDAADDEWYDVSFEEMFAL